MYSLSEFQLKEAIRLTIAGNSPMVKEWQEDRPGSWGFLAGKAVLACRQQLGRKLTNLERRSAWQELWNSLNEEKQVLLIGSGDEGS